MKFSKEEIINELVKKFGEEHRAEIEKSFNTEDWYYKKFDTTDEGGGFTIDGDNYVFFTNKKSVIKCAENYVKAMLKSNPEVFGMNWLAEFIYITDIDKEIIAEKEADSMYYDFLDQARDGLEYEGAIDYENMTEDEIEKMIEETADKLMSEYIKELKNKLSDPYDYFVNELKYDIDEFLKLSFIHINIDSATDEAIRTDGWDSYLATYGGIYNTTKRGIIYFRIW